MSQCLKTSSIKEEIIQMIQRPPLEPERYELFAEPRYEFEPDRRDFLKIVGSGIVVCLVLGESQAQQRGSSGARVLQLSSWLHISETGQVTVYTGKVELGQNIRTSLSQVVAEELGLPVAAIRLVMADTELTPHDPGTFGSLTTPIMGSELRRVAAAAREMLIDLASEKAQVGRAFLAVADGKVTHQQTKRSFTFGELTNGKRLKKTVGLDVPVTPVGGWQVAGTSVPKVEGRAFVTGQHRFASDVRLPGMLYGKVLRPATLNATLQGVNLKAAEAMPGVTVVHDGNFVGVAAGTEHLADQALSAIQAEWKSPPEPSDTDLFESLKRSPVQGQEGRADPVPVTESPGLKGADHKLHTSYTVAYIAHAPMEPRAAVAEWKEGKLTVWTGTQMPFPVRGELARAFGLAPAKIRVIAPDTGSAFGGKHTGEAAIEAARLAKAAGKPVKLVWTREEEFTWAYFRPAGVIEVTSGMRKDGKIIFWEVHNYNSGGSGLYPPYDVPRPRRVFHHSQSPLRQGSYRALAATANHFARESHIDDLARLVALDPLEFRLKNLKDQRMCAVLEAAAKQFGWGKGKPAPGHGFGMAGGTEKGSYVATCAEVAADSTSGKLQVVRLVTAFECGAIINPDHLKNQVEGAVVMGLGGALFEVIRFADGKIQNASFSRYRVPRFSDVPILETVLLDRKDLPSAGAGETPIVAVAPAIANAIFHATGKRLNSLPMAPDGIRG